jgi:ABC-type branched-subunit amino acid transport system substrate-binding protein
MKQKRWVWAIALVTVLALAVAACGSSSKKSSTSKTTTKSSGAGNARGNVNGQLVLGKLLPQSGDLSVIFKALDTPVNMAVQEINAAGGVNGKPVAMQAADDGTSPDVASASLDTLLTSGKVDAILGPASSGTATGIIDKINTAGVVDCSGSTTAASLSGISPWFFRTAPPDKLQGPALAQLVINDGKNKVAILVRNDAYGTGFGKALETALKNGGANVVLNAAYDPSASDFSADVSKVKAKAPDAVILIGFNDDGGKIVKEMIAQGIGPKQLPLYTADGMQSSSFYKSVDASNPGAIAGIKGTAPAAAPSGINHPFTAAYKKTGQDTIFSAYYYDCTNLIALAAQAAGSDDPAKIKDKMLEVSKGGTKCQTYAACLALLKQGKDIDYDGASGPVDLDNNHEPTVGVYDVWAYGADGKYNNVAGVKQIKIG